MSTPQTKPGGYSSRENRFSGTTKYCHTIHHLSDGDLRTDVPGVAPGQLSRYDAIRAVGAVADRYAHALLIAHEYIKFRAPAGVVAIEVLFKLTDYGP